MDCSICRRDAREVRKLIAGPTVYICDRCTAAAVSILAGKPDNAAPDLALSASTADACSFCGGPKPKGLDLLTSAAANICGACLEICCLILSEESLEDYAPQEQIDALKARNRGKGWNGPPLWRRIFHA